MRGDDDPTRLPVKFKQPPADEATLALVPIYSGPCSHSEFFEVDERLDFVECRKCGEKLSPMWVLAHLAKEESRWAHHARQYQDEMKRLNKRHSTKCEHCQRMTRISRR